LERLSARLATSNARASDLAAMREALAAMDVSGDKSAFNDADTAYHVAIAGAAGNRLVADMTVAIRESMRLPLLDAFRNVGEWDDLVDRLRAQHQAIYRAIEARDADRAEDLVEEHIRSAWRRLAPSFDRRWGTGEDAIRADRPAPAGASSPDEPSPSSVSESSR